MTYRASDLSAISYANGFTMWHYRTHDAIDAMSAGYFDEAHKMLRSGDFIMVNGHTIDGRPEHGVLVVTRNEEGSVETMVGMRVQP